jgi:Ca2+-binding EF-hand superfamily protein
LQGRNPTDEEIRALMGFVDKDGDGEIDFEEFLVMVTTHIREVMNVTFKVITYIKEASDDTSKNK